MLKLKRTLAVLLAVLIIAAVCPLTAFAQYSKEYYAISGTKYIYTTCLYYSSSSNSAATDWLSNNGWTPVGGNFNAADDNNSKYIHLGVTYTTDASIAVRGFAVRDGDRPDYYDAPNYNGVTVRWYKVGSGVITQTPAAGDGVVDLNKGGGGNDLTLYITIDPNAGPPITDFVQFQSSSSDSAKNNLLNSGYTPAQDQSANWQDCNEGSGGDYLYEGYKSSCTSVSTNSLRSAYNNSANYVNSSNYTSTSRNVLANARSAALTIMNALDGNGGVSSYTQSQIDDATSTINSALAALQTTLTFNGNGGSVNGSASNNITVGTSSSYNYTATQTATRTGYTFKGWSTSTSATSGSQTLAACFSKTYYAAWLINSSNLKVDPNGGTWNSSTSASTITKNYGTNYTVANPTRTGYTFSGWSTALTNGTFNSSSKVFTFGALSGTTDTLTANWNINTYTATFKDYDGTVLYTTTIPYGTTPVYSASTPTRATDDNYHYTFSGWSTTPAPITANITYTAVYTQTPHNYNGNAQDNGDGTHSGTCTINECGRIGNAAAHTYGEQNVYENPTCTTKGEYFAICTACNATTYGDVDALGHDYTKKEINVAYRATTATCVKHATYYYLCSRCDNVSDTLTYEDPDSTLQRHSYTIYVGADTPATCTANEIAIYKCKNCDATNTKVKPNSMLPHEYTVYVSEVTAASCVANATATYKCENCDATAVQQVPGSMLPHVYSGDVVDNGDGTHSGRCVNGCGEYGTSIDCEYGDWSVVTDSTCTETGVKERYCTTCNHRETGVIDKKGHSYTKETTEFFAEAATCTSPAKYYKSCANCGAQGTETFTYGEKLPHTFTIKQSTVTPATCLDDETATYKCANCDATDVLAVENSKLSHSYTGDIKSNDDGTHSFKCTNGCNKYGGAANCTYGEFTVTTAATCVATGSKYHTCSECEYVETVVIEIDSTNHVGGTVSWNKEASACDEQGYSGDIRCASCYAILEYGEVLEYAPHTWNDWKVVTEPTCVAKGEKTRECSKCDAEENDEIEINPDNHAGETVIKGDFDATCILKGYTGDTYCADCDVLLSYGEGIPVTEHPYGEVEVTKAASCSQTGKGVKTCTYCGEETEVILDKDPNNHVGGTKTINAKDATCSEKGYTGDIKCMVCGNIKTYGEEIETLPHSYGDWAVVKAATCAAKGTERRTCNDCTAFEDRDIAIDPDTHTGETYKLGYIDSTCTSTGFTGDVYCKGCN